MNDQDHPAFIAAHDAVGLLLTLGEDSLRPDILAITGRGLNISPLAGQLITSSKLTEGMCVGENQGDGNFHVTLRLTVNDHPVEAYCLVSSDERGPRLVQAYIYVDGVYVVHRNVSILRNGDLEPWGMPEGR